MESLEGKRVAILGFGVEGRSALRYFQARGADVVIVDESDSLNNVPEGVETITGENALSSLTDFDLISRSPAIRPDRINTRGEVTSVTNEFFRACPAPIIAVTGTKGKGTTTTLTAKILESAGKRVHVVGNIGVPALDVLEDIHQDDIVCYEASSFQLWDLKKSPQVAVILMMAEDHMDVHSSMDEYIGAKAMIGAHQTPDDLLVVHANNQYSQRAAASSKARKAEYLSETGAYLRGEDIIINEHKICSTRDVGLLGRHNLENVCAAITAAWEYTQDVEAIAKAVKDFTGLPHRLEKVGTIAGADYYDDSFSTAPATTIAAIETFEQPKILILGGSDKGAHYDELARVITNSSVRGVVLIGDTAEAIDAALRTAGYEGQVFDGGIKMRDIVVVADSLAESGDVVLLSPACASFGLFDNYKQRGELFAEAVKKMSS